MAARETSSLSTSWGVRCTTSLPGKMTGPHQATERVANDAGGDQGGDLGIVVGRRALDHLDAGQGSFGDELDELEHFPGQEPTRLGPTGPGDEGGIQAVDIEGQPDGLGA